MQIQESYSIPRATTFGRENRLTLDGAIMADDFEKQLNRFYGRGSPDRPLLIDMQQATFIEVATLVNCIATIVDRQEKQYRTFIACPVNQRVRDFIKVWRFFDAIEKATGLMTSDFLVKEDQDFPVEPQNTYTGHGNAINKLEFDPDWDPRKPMPRNFFEFVTFSEGGRTEILPEGRFASIPRDEGKKWTRPLIQQILEKHLPGGTTKDEVARVIIYEAVSNAVRHPCARTIQVVSRFERHEELEQETRGSLRICIWDDGKSIASTLMEALDNGSTINAFNLPPYMCDKVYVTRRNFSQTRSENHLVDQSEQITKQTATEQRVLLASMFPGVTRTVVAKVARVSPFEDGTDNVSDNTFKLEEALRNAPGMGLYSLMRTVLDQFSGTLFIRSGNSRLLIESAHDTFRIQHQCRYKCKITDYEKHMPAFKGNLLAIQLPLKG